ncbi:hypothetical protein QTP86_006017 [Hemibagrus guttatus]|nr:hypothetical protein QTP86_006017 [Hemibagrus guttatus]
MLALINRLLDWFRSLFWKEEMELTLVGLQYSGKTTFVNVIASGQFSEDMIPTVGFNMRKVTKGNVTIKIWDIGGQPRFRSMWERYCRGVNAIVYMVDAADRDKIEPSRNELHNLLDKPQLQGIPVLVLGNKRDLPNALDEKQLIEKMNLAAIQDREICCYSVSCKEKDNIGEWNRFTGDDTPYFHLASALTSHMVSSLHCTASWDMCLCERTFMQVANLCEPGWWDSLIRSVSAVLSAAAGLHMHYLAVLRRVPC